MSFANTTANSEWSVNSGKAYVATGPFHTAFYSYTAAQNSSLATVGTLTLITNDATKCPSGRILALNGRKLTPGANPMNFITATFGAAPTAATPRLYLGVADLVSGVSGFIDPNNVLFAPYDKNRPVGDYLVDMSAGLTTSQALSQIHSGASANILTKSAGLLDASAVTGTQVPATGVNSAACGTVKMATIASATVPVTALVSSTLLTANSVILLTPTSAGVLASVTAITIGATSTFTISIVTPGGVSVTTPSVNYLIIN